MDEHTGRRVCELVMGIIATDNELHPTEFAFMLKTFKTFGVATGSEDEALTPATRALEAAKAMSELPEDVQAEAIDLLLESAAIDGKIVKAERTFLHAVARAANITVEIIDSRIDAKLAAVKLKPPV